MSALDERPTVSRPCPDISIQLPPTHVSTHQHVQLRAMSIQRAKFKLAS